MHHPEILEKEGKTIILLGTEAIARGALEAGVGFSASYPGTPSSEVSNTLAALAKELGFYFEWSANEKVAFEAAAGAAFCGVRSLTAMKHFGFNVASDSIYPVIYTGVRGGMVIMVADDPGGLSSAQSEQDTRHSSHVGNIPTIEPSNPQECKDFTKLAFEISEKYGIPVMLRTTTRVSHAIGSVKLGKLQTPKAKGKFVKDRDRYYNIAPALQKLHRRALEKLAKIEAEYSGKLNKIEGSGKAGIIANGVSYEYVKELPLKGVRIAKLGMAHPIPKGFIAKFLQGLDLVIVVEELEPIIEESVRLVAKDANPSAEIHGKDILPRDGEYSPELVYERIAPLLKLPKRDFSKQDAALAKIRLPKRKPVLCQGCPHRSTFYAVREALGESTVWSGDVGCYVLGIFEPFKMQDFMLSMGASLGVSHGIKKVGDQKVVAFIGDSTFFHAAMPGIVNLKYNNSNPLIVIMDNGTTAMTGHQPNPGVPDGHVPVKIEDVVKAFGIENIKIANAYSQKDLQAAVKELDRKGELGVLIARGICRLLMKRQLRAKGQGFTVFEIDPKKCTRCGECTDRFSCPAIYWEGKEVRINPDVCWGCSVCAQICPPKAISPKVKR